MQRIGSIGKKKQGRLISSFSVKLICIILILLVTFLFFNSQFHRILTLLSENQLSLFFSTIVNKAISEKIGDLSKQYESFITLTFKENGDVASLSANMPLLISLQNSICDDIFGKYAAASPLSIDFPILLLLGIDFISAHALSLNIKVLPTKYLHTYFTSEFIEAGINQTLHRIVFHVEGTFSLLLPGKFEKIKVSEHYCVAETLIAGRVPDAFTEINRLTDDIIESEIDDIYDFGASVN